MVIIEKIDIQWDIFDKSKFFSKISDENSYDQMNIDCDGKKRLFIFLISIA